MDASLNPYQEGRDEAKAVTETLEGQQAQPPPV